MIPEEFKHLHMCTFEPDLRSVALDEAFDKYYRDSEHLNDREARKLWSELRSYARDMGFTGGQFQEAKMRATGRIANDNN